MELAERVVFYLRLFLYAVWLKYGVRFEFTPQNQNVEQYYLIQTVYLIVIILLVMLVITVVFSIQLLLVSIPTRNHFTSSFFGTRIMRIDSRQDRTKHHDLGFLRIFLCYSSPDKLRAKNLYQSLRLDRFDPWLDEEKLVAGQDWGLEIAKAIQDSDVVLVLLSLKSVHRTGYMQKEIRMTLDLSLEKPEGQIFIIPVRLEECEVPNSLKKWHWVNLFEEAGYDKLKRALAQRTFEQE